ncbi:hypothetical protein FHR88_000389 [Bradyrhizobium betae]|nr:hypothetical protein [Bradyrhizobium betae]
MMSANGSRYLKRQDTGAFREIELAPVRAIVNAE